MKTYPRGVHWVVRFREQRTRYILLRFIRTVESV